MLRSFNTKTEEILAELWSNLFPNSTVTPESDFFELGGNSLSFLKLQVMIEERWGNNKWGEDILAADSIFEIKKLNQMALTIDLSLNKNNK